MQHRNIVALTLLAVCLGVAAHGADIEGKVVKVADGRAEIQVSGDLSPQVGDAARIVLVIPGSQIEASAGEGKVAEVRPDAVVLTIDRKTTRIRPGYSVHIDSANPVRRHGDPRPAGAAGVSAAAAIDALPVTPEEFLAIVVRPRRIAQTPLTAELLRNEASVAEIKKLGIAPDEVEQIVILLRPGKNRWGTSEPVPVMLVRFTHEVDAKELLTKAAALDGHQSAIQEIEVGGKTCLDLRSGDAFLAYAPNKNTIVLTSKANMEEVISGGESKGPLLERLKKADADNDLIVAFAPEALPDFEKTIDAAKRNAPPLLQTYLDAAKTLRGGTAICNQSGPRLLQVVLDAKDSQAAAHIEELLRQALRMAAGGLLLATQSLPKEQQVMSAPLLKLGDELLDGARVTASGSRVTLDVKRPKTLDDDNRSLLTAVRQVFAKAGDAGLRTQRINNMKMVALGILNYEAAYSRFPPAAIEKEGRPLLSWRVALLPYLDEPDLYGKFHLDEPWDSPHNLEVAKKVPAVFQTPGALRDGKTRIMLFTGKGAAFDGGRKIRAADITDGMSNTLLCVEAGADKAVPWSKPEDLPFDPEAPLAAVGVAPSQGFIAAFFDGHVMQIRVDNKTLKALITPDGGESIDPNTLTDGK